FSRDWSSDVCSSDLIAGRAVKTYEEWRRVDKEFARRVDEVREQLKQKDDGKAQVKGRRDISFEEFRREYLGRETYPHQRAWIQRSVGRRVGKGGNYR